MMCSAENCLLGQKCRDADFIAQSDDMCWGKCSGLACCTLSNQVTFSHNWTNSETMTSAKAQLDDKTRSRVLILLIRTEPQDQVR